MLLLAGASSVHESTTQYLLERYTCFNTALLNELRAGAFQAIRRSDIEKYYPEEFQRRQADKLRYRYPGVGGESYLDVIERVRPIIIELERQRRSVVVVCHLAVLRCIYAYFMGTKPEEIPYLSFPQHRIVELSPGPFGCTAEIKDPRNYLSGARPPLRRTVSNTSTSSDARSYC